ncbi:neuromedin-S isoform X3 [Pygocentrus nattereri]|uniref:neuromedin-S isoform X3 n=1 Tax=Pygocentrus nattereri TaxID=42514 RepID=UPI0008148DBC|nr:neuromedin-S isoform X3 [Pygocentrus nattereri]
MSFSVAQLNVLYLLLWGFSRQHHTAESYPLTDCEEDGDYMQGSAVQSTLCGLVWQDQNKEQIQNVFKRFLFHYSKAQNSVGSVERESHSVHPLMRLSPKFTQRRKKQQVHSLKTVCSRSNRLQRDVLCSLFGCSMKPQHLELD